MPRKKQKGNGKTKAERDAEKFFSDANKFLKKTQIISKGLKAAAPLSSNLSLIPHPIGQALGAAAPGVLKSVGDAAQSLGYGHLNTNMVMRPRSVIRR
jgi:hypothetical protein